MVEKARLSSTSSRARKSSPNWRWALEWLLRPKAPPESKLEQAERLLNEAGFYLRRTPAGLLILPREVNFEKKIQGDWWSPKNDDFGK
jgi:hypothetical protein